MTSRARAGEADGDVVDSDFKQRLGNPRNSTHLNELRLFDSVG